MSNMDTSNTQVNIHVLDAAYRPFPTFAEWVSKASVDTVRWERYTSSLKSRASASPEVLNRAREIAKRAAALDTGAIEGLYEVDRGFTYSVAVEASAWEAALTEKGEMVRSLFEAQLHAYDYVLDLATKAEPISEAAIRVLHEVVTGAQATYRVITAVGPQEQALPKGQYKALPNHVRTRKGSDHSYAPVDVTPAEMARLVAELRSEAFLSAHSVIQASYAHYCLVVVHPFSDGNGRVARALASAFTYRAINMPIVILSEHKNVYLDSLEDADRGDYQSFVDFMLARSLDTIKLVDESILAALSPSPEQSIATINSLYVTKGGYAHETVDVAGTLFMEAVDKKFKETVAKYDSTRVLRDVRVMPAGYQLRPGYRIPKSGGKMLHLEFSSTPPASAVVKRDYVLFLPTYSAGHDDVQLASLSKPSDSLTVRMDELVPSISDMLYIRLSVFAERLMGEMLDELRVLAQKTMGAGRPG